MIPQRFVALVRQPINLKMIHRVWLMGALTIVSAAQFIPRMFAVRGDGPDYLTVMEYLNGTFVGEFTFYNRLIAAPLFLTLSFLLGKILADISLGLLVMNIIGYFALISGMYCLARRVFASDLVALAAAFFLMTNHVLLNFGLAYMADTWGIAFFVWGSYWAIGYYQQPKEKKYYWLAVATAIVGFFFREYGALGILTLGMVLLLRIRPTREMIYQGLTAAVCFVLLPLLFYWWFYQQFHYSYFDWFSRNVDVYIQGADQAAAYSLLLIVKILGWLFLAGWPLVIFALWHLRQATTSTRWALLSLLPASLFFLIWPSQNERVAFIFVPLLSLLAGFAIGRLRIQVWIFVCLFTYLIINYFTWWLKQAINL